MDKRFSVIEPDKFRYQTTVVVFNSLEGNHFDNIEWHEFSKTLSQVKANVISVHDLKQGWYWPHFELRDRLDRIMRWSGTDFVFIGHSMGAYGAMLLGEDLQADVVLAFSPMIAMDRFWLNSIGDHRWEKYISVTRPPDLRAALLGRAKHHVYVGDDRDRKHAETVQDIVTVHNVGTNHNTAMELKKKGLLVPEIEKAIEGVTSG